MISISSRLARPASGRRSVARPAPVREARRPVRLTRRGRFAAYGLAVLLLVAGLAVLLLAFDPAAGAVSPESRSDVTEVVVEPGDTLWSVAVRHEPSQDPSVTIEEIRRLNHLPGYTVHPGQTLRMP
ncbi:MAG: LysM peptidoglycan-binding domain-containing protein [Micromonosporaceae bacterium]